MHDSYCAALTDAYQKGAQENYDVQRLDLRKLQFDLNSQGDARYRAQPLEPDIVRSQELLTWCNHLTLVYPIWWATMPALLKGWFDRVLLPGFAFQFRGKGPEKGHERFMKGRSAHMIVPSFAPYAFYLFGHCKAPYNVVKRQTIGFVGFGPTKLTPIGLVHLKTDEQRQKILDKIEGMGRRGAGIKAR